MHYAALFRTVDVAPGVTLSPATPVDSRAICRLTLDDAHIDLLRMDHDFSPPEPVSVADVGLTRDYDALGEALGC
jgi:hypothetical protein